MASDETQRLTNAVDVLSDYIMYQYSESSGKDGRKLLETHDETEVWEEVDKATKAIDATIASLQTALAAANARAEAAEAAHGEALATLREMVTEIREAEQSRDLTERVLVDTTEKLLAAEGHVRGLDVVLTLYAAADDRPEMERAFVAETSLLRERAEAVERERDELRTTLDAQKSQMAIYKAGMQINLNASKAVRYDLEHAEADRDEAVGLRSKRAPRPTARGGASVKENVKEMEELK